MPPDRLLSTVLRAYQSPPSAQQTSGILSTTTSLLTSLSNPLNVTLLTSHLLTAPAVWDQADELHTSLRVISVYNTAAITVQTSEGEEQPRHHDAYQARRGGGIGCEDWARAVVGGLNEQSPRWRHVLVLTGILLGMEGQERHGLSRGMRLTLENALVTAVNLTVDGPVILGADAVVLALNHAFPLLSDGVRAVLNYDSLVMVMVRAMTRGGGYKNGMFLDAINHDILPVTEGRLQWSAESASFLQLQRLAAKPLITSMGPLSRLVAHALENCRSPLKIVEAREEILAFSASLLERWRNNLLSTVDHLEEPMFLAPETLSTTSPFLWQIMKPVMFATVVILRAIVGRTLIDPVLSSTHYAPNMASQSLFILRNLHFISSRLGPNAFSAYGFVNLASIDILTRFPEPSASFLRSISSSQLGQLPRQPLQRNLDLFYLNTVEHFTLVLSSFDAEELVVKACTPYLSPSSNHQHLDLFEAAHSAMLSFFSSPQNAESTARVIPFYTESLFASFPMNLSPRQFRFAFKTLIQICTPPNLLAASHPMIAETLLEMLYHRALSAPTTPLPPFTTIKGRGDAEGQQIPLSEQAVLLLALLDALPNVSLKVLEEWLSLSADVLYLIQDNAMKEHCRQRFWEVLESGEMDIERSAICVGWWATKGGREMVMDRGLPMSGGLAVRDRSRL